MPADSQGTTFSFAGNTYDLTSIKVKRARSTVDASTLTLTSGSQRQLQAAPLIEGDTITIEVLGASLPLPGALGAISCSLGVEGNAICEESEVTAAVGELIKGTATLRMTNSSST